MASQTVTIDPIQRNGQYLIADVFGADNKNLTDKEYWSRRNNIERLPLSIRDEYSEFARDRSSGKFKKSDMDTKWSQDRISRLSASLEKQGVSMNSANEQILNHMRQGVYSPDVLVSVNNRPMNAAVVRNELLKSGIDAGESPKSTGPGRISGGSMRIDEGGYKTLYQEAEAESNKRFGQKANIEHGNISSVKAQLSAHIGSRAPGWCGRVVAGGAALLAASGAVSAAEKEAGKPLTTAEKASVVAKTVLGTAVPGYKDASRGDVCKGVGDAVGTAAEGTVWGVGLTGAVATSEIGVGLVLAVVTPVAAESAGNLGRQGGESLCKGAVGLAQTAAGTIKDFTNNAGDMFNRVSDEVSDVAASIKQTLPGFGM